MDLQQGFSSFLNQIGNLLPGVLGALLVLIIGWLIASGLKRLTKNLLSKTSLDDRLFKGAKSSVSPENFISKLVYYIAMVIVLLVVLEMLGVSQVLDPLKNMANEFFTFVPNIIAALLIGFVGYIIANIGSELVGFGGTAVEKFSGRLGLNATNSSVDLSNILKKLVFILIFIPILIAALDALKIDAISGPATEMLSSFMGAIPNIFAAVLIIGAFYIGGRFLMGLLKDLLHSMGVDDMAERLNLSSMLGNQSLSKLLPNIAFFFIMFFGIITGIEKLGFTQLNGVLTDVLGMSGRIFFGLLILVLGNYLANIAYDAVSKGDDSAFLANIARFAILGLFLSIALNQMGIADNIVNLAFGLTLGAIAVAVALAFGLGGREAAGKQMEYILKKFRNEE